VDHLSAAVKIDGRRTAPPAGLNLLATDPKAEGGHNRNKIVHRSPLGSDTE
jgi:hypothetical protein